jgi:KDO2-lipid IV(A) lauroyltransferase
MQTIEYILVRFFYEMLRRIPFSASAILAYVMAFILQHVVRYRKNHVFSCLQDAFQDINSKRLRAIARNVYVNFCMLWVESLQSWRLNENFYTKHFTIYNWDIVEQLYQHKKGIIFIAGHMGNFEWLGYYIASKLPNFHVIMKRIKNPRVNEFSYNTRQNQGIHLIYTREAIKKGKKVLEEGKLLGVIADQDARDRGIFVDFMGKPASTARGSALFHLKTGAPMIFTAIIRKSWGNFDIHFEPIPDSVSKEFNETNIFAITQTHTKKLEEWVRKYPGQYFWTHKRWKTKPSSQDIEQYNRFKDLPLEKYFKQGIYNNSA